MTIVVAVARGGGAAVASAVNWRQARTVRLKFGNYRCSAQVPMSRLEQTARDAVNRVLRPLGYVLQVRDDRTGVASDDARFSDLFRELKPYTMLDRDRLYSVYTAVRYVVEYDIPGDLVECGVYRGGCCMLMAQVLGDLGSDRRIWLYDTFAGMAEPSAADGAGAMRLWRARRAEGRSDWLYAPLDEVKANLARTGHANLQFVAGRVEETIPDRAPERIALLRLDTDLYEPTRHEMEHLYPRLSPGGVYISDDYGSWVGARKAIDEYFAALGGPILLSRVGQSVVGVKP